jgi:thiol-disulfide isomerase/thioredoxin
MKTLLAMKLTILIFLTLLSFFSYGQTIDSAYIEKFIGNRYKTDTTSFLPTYKFNDDKGNSLSLGDFRGKILYIDVWSTTCPPCLAQFPHREQLLNRLKRLHLDTSIIFININIEDSKRNWKKAIKKYQPVGINLHCSDTSLYNNWNIHALPCHILLSKTGYLLGQQIAGPDDGMIDWILYSSIKGNNLIDAIWRSFNQSKLMEKYKTSKVITDEEYAKWFNDLMPALLEYDLWRKNRNSSKTK